MAKKKKENDEIENKDEKKITPIKVILLSLAVFAVCIGVLGYFLVTKNIISFGGSNAVQSAEKDNPKEAESLPLNDKSKAYVDLGEFTVNLSGNEGKAKNYMKCKINVGYDKGSGTAKNKLTKEFAIPVINDVILNYMSSKSYDYLINNENREQIKLDLVNKINEQLKDFQITDLRFSEYVLQ